MMETQIKVEYSREWFSALMDGQVSEGEFDAVMGVLDSPGGQASDCWQVYHLIGDVLRSPDLAGCGYDLGLAQRVRASIASEPARELVPVAQALRQDKHFDAMRPAANDGVFRWKMVAGLASFAAVAAVGWSMVSGAGPQSFGGAQLAQGAAPAFSSAQVLAVAAPGQAAIGASDLDPAAPVILRDARLDELMAAHRQAAGMSAMGGASGFLRNATFEGHGR